MLTSLLPDGPKYIVQQWLSRNLMILADHCCGLKVCLRIAALLSWFCKALYTVALSMLIAFLVAKYCRIDLSIRLTIALLVWTRFMLWFALAAWRSVLAPLNITSWDSTSNMLYESASFSYLQEKVDCSGTHCCTSLPLNRQKMRVRSRMLLTILASAFMMDICIVLPYLLPSNHTLSSCQTSTICQDRAAHLSCIQHPI